MIIKGKVHKFGDDINTDDIIAAEHLVHTQAEILGLHVFKSIRHDFVHKVNRGDIIVAGKNFADENAGKIIIIDFHAEATSEKIALGYYLDGKVSAVLGTHTHVQTADEKILDGGTAYITDIGMSGAENSVLGVKKEIIIEKFLTQLPLSHKVATGESILSAVEFEIDTKTRRALSIGRISKTYH